MTLNEAFWALSPYFPLLLILWILDTMGIWALAIQLGRLVREIQSRKDKESD